MLWIALHLPALSLESFAATLGAARHALPLALLQAQRIQAVNRVARQLGVKPGLKRTTALALAPQLLFGQADAARDAQALQAVDGVEVAPAGQGEARRSWFVYPVRLAEGTDRDAVIASLAEAGIPSKAYLPCVHLFPHLRERGYGEGQFPVAEAISARSLALPFHGGMSEADVALVASALEAALGA